MWSDTHFSTIWALFACNRFVLFCLTVNLLDLVGMLPSCLAGSRASLLALLAQIAGLRFDDLLRSLVYLLTCVIRTYLSADFDSSISLRNSLVNWLDKKETFPRG